MRDILWAILLGLLSTTFLLPLPRSSSGQWTATVQEGDSIQEAIRAAQDGDIILVGPGTYYENIDFEGKAIHLKSIEGPEATILDGSLPVDPDRGSVVTFTNGEERDSILEGFMITGGTGNYRGNHREGAMWGGGIHCVGSSPTITNCRLHLNSAQVGGGISCEQSSPMVTGCRIDHNRASGLGGGASFFPESSPILANCTIYQNWSISGGGLHCREYSSPIITNCIFYKNLAGSGSGIYCKRWSSPILSNCTLFSNAIPEGMAGAMWVENLQPEAAYLRPGGGVRCDTVSNAVIENSIIAFNEEGGVVSYEGSLPSVSFSNLWKNAGRDVIGQVNLGDGNISRDPLITRDGHLSSGSPCIDVGSSEGAGSNTDVDGEFRVHGLFDLGADEFIDTDGDGLPDFWERENGLRFDDARDGDMDSDEDGVNNLEEYLYDGNPLLADIEFTLEGGYDFDWDGLSNQAELDMFEWSLGPEEIRESIYLDDTDDDGFPDGLEAGLTTDPLDPESHPGFLFGDSDRQDEDRDHLSDGLEKQLFKTNPDVTDTDADGFTDGQEVNLGSDPRDVNSIPEYDGIVVGTVRMYWESGRAPKGVNGVKVILYDENGNTVSVLTDPVFGRDGYFVAGIEKVEGPTTYYVDLVRPLPGEFEVLTTLPKVIEVKPYPPACVVEEILLEGYRDGDDDGVPDDVEIMDLLGTDPTKKDTDGDGLEDGYEILQQMNAMRAYPELFDQYCCDPNDPADRDRDKDPDMDGRTNIQEMQAGTDPNQPDNLPSCAGQDPPYTPTWSSLVKLRLESEQEDVSVQGLDISPLIPNAVTGRVSSHLTGVGLPGASLSFYRGEDCASVGGCELISTGRSEENGTFWNILQSAEYWVSVCKQGYYPEWVPFRVMPGLSTDFIKVSLRPAEPERITPDTWWEASEVQTAAAQLTGPSGRVAWRSSESDETGSLTLYVPLPGQGSAPLEGEDAERGVGAAAVAAGSAQMPPLNGQYQVDVTGQRTTGSAVTRAGPDEISRAIVEMTYRPGDAVTVGIPAVYLPDGQVSLEDALYALGIALGKEGYEKYVRSLDVVPGVIQHDEQGTLMLGQDEWILLDDALAVIRGAYGWPDVSLPDNLRGLRQERTIRLEITSASSYTIFDGDLTPLDASPLSGHLDLRLLSFPLDRSGTTFRVEGFEATTDRYLRIPPRVLPLPFVPVKYRAKLAEDIVQESYGTILGGGMGEGSYSFQLENICIDLEAILPVLGTIPDLSGTVLLQARGSWAGGQREEDAIKAHLAYSGSTVHIYADVLLDLEYSP